MRLKLLAILSISIGCFLCFGSSVHAKAVLAIEPTRLELTLKPGETANNKLRVSNRGSKPIFVEITSQAFSVINEQYDYRFSGAEELGKWLRFKQSSVEIEPGKTVNIDYELSVPNNAEPGGRYLAIFASVVSDEDQSNIVARAGQMLYLTIPGNYKKDGQFVDATVPIVVFNRNIAWSYRVRNTGNVHFYSSMEATIKTIFGNELGKTKNEHLIMPSSTKLVESSAQLPIWPGIYRLQARIAVADKATTNISRTILFVPIPLLLLLALILFWLYKLFKKLKAIKGSAPPQ